MSGFLPSSGGSRGTRLPLFKVPASASCCSMTVHSADCHWMRIYLPLPPGAS